MTLKFSTYCDGCEHYKEIFILGRCKKYKRMLRFEYFKHLPIEPKALRLDICMEEDK